VKAATALPFSFDVDVVVFFPPISVVPPRCQTLAFGLEPRHGPFDFALVRKLVIDYREVADHDASAGSARWRPNCSPTSHRR